MTDCRCPRPPRGAMMHHTCDPPPRRIHGLETTATNLHRSASYSGNRWN